MTVIKRVASVGVAGGRVGRCTEVASGKKQDRTVTLNKLHFDAAYGLFSL